MGLNNYKANGPLTVIADDLRDPYVSWQHHLDRTGGARGGVDLVAGKGTPVLAPTAGWVRRRPNNGTAGNSMWFEHRDNPGWGDVFSHLSGYEGGEGQFFEQDQVIAYTGDSGGVIAHLHRHLEKGGVRYNPWDYFSSGTAGGGTTPIVNYHWYGLTGEAMAAMQQLAKDLGIYGVLFGSGVVDGDFGENSVKSWQELGKRWGYLAADYEVDGIPHNEDQSAPSNYGFFLQRWARDKAGYDGYDDGLPAGYTSEFLVKACAIVQAEIKGGTTPPPPPPPPADEPIPAFPPAPAGQFFLPDLATSQGDFDFAEFVTAGGEHAALKMGGGNASDSPYTAPRYLDQMSRAVTAGCKEMIHYWFNGRENGLTPETSMDYFAAHSMLRVRDVVAFDIERENETDTGPWTPEETVRGISRLRVHYPEIKGLFYLSKNLYDSLDWSPVEALGWEPWIAAWGANDGEPGTNPAGDEPIWQYTSEERVPGNYRVIDGKKVYQRTDGNLANADLFDRLGWVPPTTEPGPEPSPTLEARVTKIEATLAAFKTAI